MKNSNLLCGVPVSVSRKKLSIYIHKFINFTDIKDGDRTVYKLKYTTLLLVPCSVLFLTDCFP